MELCTRHGNGICCECSHKYKPDVLCRHDTEKYVTIMELTIEDMVEFMFRNCGKFDNSREVLEYFDFKFKDGRVL